jgi:NAD(P)-dependent dehydrogenase (short-subunit alcohol dehydrogenase family)
LHILASRGVKIFVNKWLQIFGGSVTVAVPSTTGGSRLMNLEGVVGIVTGGASGLGAATARELAGRGVRVVVADIAEDQGKAVADSIDGVFARMDVTNTDEIIAAADAATALGPVRVLVNCAGAGWAARTIGRDGYGSAHNLAAFRRILEINTVGTFDCIRIVATAMAATDPLADGERGAIVNTASVAAVDGQIGQAAYAASKAGVVGMTLPIARDLAAVGIRVCTITPGLIDTPIYGEGPRAQELKDRLKRDVLFPRRLGTAEEFATMAVELLANSYMNGEAIRVDGGARLRAK